MHLEINRQKLFEILLNIYIFLSLVIVMFITLYIIGSYQMFLDTTQLYCISILSILSVVHLVIGILLFIGSLLQHTAKKSKQRRLILLVSSLVFSFILFMTLRLIQTWLRY
ncbi:MAG: hypothetical protein JW904_04935 [Spirochaetales bacterium]|nr:hypothetical protein [Spirochaetales bacterium]